VLQSRLQFGAAVKQSTEERFTAAAPLAFLEPKQVQEVRQQYLPTATPSPTPTAAPVATPTPLARAVRPTPAASPRSGAAATPGATGAGDEAAPSSRVRPRRPSGTSPQPTPGPVDEKSPYGVRRPSDSSGIVGGGVRPVSPEASLHPWWRAMPEWILAFV
jgi:hypothetical protein